MPEFLQFTFSGLTVGAIYALVALGFTLIYNASDVINFAQGEFVMIGGMVTFFAVAAGFPLPLAALIALVAAVLVGVLLHRLAIDPAKGASPVTLIIITFGGYAYDGIQLVARAIESAKSADPKKIRDALEATKGYVGVTGIYTFAPADHLGLGTDSFRMLVIRNGDWAIEAPAR